MAILPKLTYGINAIPTKILAGFSGDTDKLILKLKEVEETRMDPG